ncbi:MAG: DUF3524 domain-containing protein [Pseudomonadota bacterium]
MAVNVLFIEAFSGGSHADFVNGLAKHSRHHIDVLRLPARFWKWRMRGAALYLAPRIEDITRYDVIMSSNMMSLSDFCTLSGPSMPPAILYFHENQLTYPLPPGAVMDMQFGFTDITSALAATQVCFNSAFHMRLFLDTLPGFIRKMPEFHPDWVVKAIRRKSSVHYPGVDLTDAGDVAERCLQAPPLVIWNHRWEFDKNPDDFFDALIEVAGRGIDFRLAILGKNYQNSPHAFENARSVLSDRIVAYGHEPYKETYRQWLRQGHLVVSTAVQENYGISIIEAIHAGCLPLLPRRLSYPEILPARYHDAFIYEDQGDLVEKLCRHLGAAATAMPLRRALSAAMTAYGWSAVIAGYDEMLETVAAAGNRAGKIFR